MLVRFQVLTAASMKVTLFWDIAQCSLVEVDRRHQAVDGGSTYLRNVGLLQRDYIAPYPRRVLSSFVLGLPSNCV
jgi:hypothetical protein